jgi:beta-N-acetylhexosaminidase
MLGPLIVDVLGQTLTEQDIQLLRYPIVGGVVLFTRNYESLEQLRQLTSAIKAIRDPELLICIDHEGGAVQRLREGFTRLPAMNTLGKLYAIEPAQALMQAEQLGFTMASELRAYGVDLSFAPVLDLNKGLSNVLQGGRAISASVDAVIRIAKAYIAGMHRAKMAAIGKHFPGHGSVSLDSHFALPVDKRDAEEIMQEDCHPFSELITTDLQGIMPAHIIFPAVDSVPASLSTVWLNDILRQQLGFKGTVISDCLSMAGAVETFPEPAERVAAALQAGCDLVLLCNDRPAQLAVVESLQVEPNVDLADKIENIKEYHE